MTDVSLLSLQFIFISRNSGILWLSGAKTLPKPHQLKLYPKTLMILEQTKYLPSCHVDS